MVNFIRLSAIILLCCFCPPSLAESNNADSIENIINERKVYIAMREYLIRQYSLYLSGEVALKLCDKEELSKRMARKAKPNIDSDYVGFSKSNYYKKEFDSVELERQLALITFAGESLDLFRMGYWMGLREVKAKAGSSSCDLLLKRFEEFALKYH